MVSGGLTGVKMHAKGLSIVLISGAIGSNEARMLTASPLANSAQPLSVICLLLDISRLVMPVLTCKVSIEKAWLAGG